MLTYTNNVIGIYFETVVKNSPTIIKKIINKASNTDLSTNVDAKTIDANKTLGHIAIAVTAIEGVGKLVVICDEKGDIASRVKELNVSTISQAATEWYEVTADKLKTFTDILDKSGFKNANPDALSTATTNTSSVANSRVVVESPPMRLISESNTEAKIFASEIIQKVNVKKNEIARIKVGLKTNLIQSKDTAKRYLQMFIGKLEALKADSPKNDRGLIEIDILMRIKQDYPEAIQTIVTSALAEIKAFLQEKYPQRYAISASADEKSSVAPALTAYGVATAPSRSVSTAKPATSSANTNKGCPGFAVCTIQ